MKTLAVEPLTRVEGHGRVELGLQGGEVRQVRVALFEAPRLFEGLVLGRCFSEVPALICRICAICSGVHRIAAAGALEQALGLSIPPLAAKLRELLLLGGHIESHALHLFLLILPDLRAQESILPLLAQQDDCALAGLELKRLGNRLQEVAGGRSIHPVNVEVGGVVARPRPAALETLLAELVVWQGRLEDLLAPFAAKDAYPPATPALGLRISVVGGADFSLQGDTLRLGDDRQQPASNYAELLAEHSLSYSNAKSPGGGPFLTGALARQENHARRRGQLRPGAGSGIHGNNLAQAEELHWALERARVLIEELLAASAQEPLLNPPQPRAGVGTTAIEAPRGLLVHHYQLDGRGRVAAADIVTPTAINQAAMELQLLADLKGCAEADLGARAQRIVRAYDPCISCAVHLLRLD
jgi:coenzyme F420-reducing hydrogenase alpha subunit